MREQKEFTFEDDGSTEYSSPWMWAGISPLSWWAAGGCAVVPPLVASPENKKKTL
jgi:hypothetical protein